MPSQSEEEVPVTFSNENEEEIYSVIPLEILLNEYNLKNATGPTFLQKPKLPPRSCTPYFSGESATLRHGFGTLTPYKPTNTDLLKEVLNEKFLEPTKFIENIPDFAAGVTVAQLLNELGIKGKVYEKKVGNKTYVVLKGYAGNRATLRGTRYLSTHPKIVELGLAKVDIKSAFKTGYKTSIYVYGGVKALEAIEIVLTDAELKPRYFSEVPADIPKLAVNAVLAAGTAAGVVTLGIPAAAGAGIVLVVSVVGGIAIDVLDKKVGFTDKVSDFSEKAWENLKSWWDSIGKKEEQIDLLEGLEKSQNLAYHIEKKQIGDQTIYIV